MDITTDMSFQDLWNQLQSNAVHDRDTWQYISRMLIAVAGTSVGLSLPLYAVLGKGADMIVDYFRNPNQDTKNILISYLKNDFEKDFEKTKTLIPSAEPSAGLPRVSEMTLSTLDSPITLKNYDCDNSPGHVLMIGATGSGKTTLMITHMLLGKFKQDKPNLNYTQFVLIDNGMDSESPIKIRDAALKNMRIDFGHADKENEFVYFNLKVDKQENATSFISNSKERKLVFWDDSQATAEKAMTSQFLLNAKNMGAQVVLAVHKAVGGDGSGVGVRDSARYWVAINVDQHNFQHLFKLEKNNPLWVRYQGIPNHQERIIIYDNLDKKFYNSNFQDFIPLIEKK